MTRIILTSVLCYFLLPFSHAQNGYSNFSKQSARLHSVSDLHPQSVKLKSISKTTGGKDIWMLTIGTGETQNKPAIAIVGGVEGNQLLGTELCIGFAEKLLALRSDSLNSLLSQTTFYIFPDMSPDAMEQYFAPLKYERQGNASPQMMTVMEN